MAAHAATPTFSQRLTGWFSRPRAPEAGVIVLGQRRVYILPTRNGAVFAAVMLMMLIGSINYSLSLGFVLTFLLTSMGFTAMLHTYRNLVQLHVSAGRAAPVFAGGEALFTVNLANPAGHARYAIGLALDRRGRGGARFADLPARGAAPLSIAVPARRRGRLRPGRLTLFTRFPLGMYCAWGYVRPDMHCIVYPRPTPKGLPLPPAENTAGAGAAHGLGQEDFAGLRPWHIGDPPRHIAWKAAARGQGLLTKQFTGEAASEVWLAWDHLPAHLNTEVKLSHMTRWVLDADELRLAYGLRLPNTVIPIASGDAQRQRCLEALALFDLPDAFDEHGDEHA
jgi:uncharacterized protein (DUF58 family)